MNENINKILTAVNTALSKHKPENVDVVANKTTRCLHVIYHSHDKSYPLSSAICRKDDVNLHELYTVLSELGVGIYW